MASYTPKYAKLQVSGAVAQTKHLQPHLPPHHQPHLPVPSRSSVAAEPLKTDAMPPVWYRYPATSRAPVKRRGKSCGCASCTWRMHLRRSPGAMMAVVGTALRAPATPICAKERPWSELMP